MLLCFNHYNNISLKKSPLLACSKKCKKIDFWSTSYIPNKILKWVNCSIFML